MMAAQQSPIDTRGRGECLHPACLGRWSTGVSV